MSTISPDVRAVLLKVRDEILTDESKWAQGLSVEIETTPTCLGMALIQATQVPSGPDVFKAARRALGFELGDNMPDWNDAPERTFADIRQRLDLAIGAES